MKRPVIHNVLASILDNVSQAIFWKDLNSVYLGCNQAFAIAAGLSHPDEVIGKTDFDLPWTREDSEIFRADDREVMRSNKVKRHIVLQRHSRAGECVWVDASKIPLTDGTKVFGVLGVFEDITERKQAEEALRESEARARRIQAETEILLRRHQALMKTAIDGIHVLDIRGNLVEANDSFCSMLGYTQEEALTLNVSDWDRNWSAEELRKRIKHLIEGRISSTFETMHCRKDGSMVNVEVSCSGVQTEDGHYLFCSSRDITERKRVEAEQQMMQTQLMQAQKMESIGHLTGGIAHDFNNMLGAMLGYAELIKQTGSGSSAADARTQKYIGEILTAGTRAKELIRQMLLFSRPHPEPYDGAVPSTFILPVVKEVVYLLRASIPSTIEISYAGEDENLRALIQPVQLHQILMNLAINARDAIGEYGRIEIRLDRRSLCGICDSCHEPFSGDYVEIAVSDTGMGIPAHQLPKIFDPFFTTKEVGRGSGMGLSVVHGIVRALGGHVMVKSEAGKGTTFRILLPGVASVAPGMSEHAMDIPHVDNLLQGLRIMVVDDEHAMSSMLQELLGMHGAEVSACNHPLEALTAFTRDPGSVDLVITDETMPEMSGMDMAKAMLKQKPELPVLLCTGYSENLNARIAAQSGIAGFMVKPLVVSELLQWIQKLAAISHQNK